jgi:DNA-binding MarR family transcriptional regulator
VAQTAKDAPTLTTRSTAAESTRLLYAIARLERATRRELERGLQPLGLTVSQYTALSVLRSRSGLSSAQLARRSYVSPQAMNELIAALDAKGLITRRPSPSHQRILQATLTPRGRQVARRGDKVVDQVEDVMLDGVAAADRAALLVTIRGCVQRMHAGLVDD